MTDTAGSGGGVKLQIQGATKNFGGVRAVANVSADVQEGEVVAIIGPNGAGKTTMLNMISGFYLLFSLMSLTTLYSFIKSLINSAVVLNVKASRVLCVTLLMKSLTRSFILIIW